MKYYIIAGEASGDLHGSNLMKELKKADPAAEIRCWGGDKMQAAGGDLVMHYRKLAFMGFAEVLKNIRTIFRNLRFCREDISRYRPDVLVLIDYPGFNLRIARWAKQQGFGVVYYISPQVWAWKPGRVKMMKTCIDKMLVILPFEKEYFQERWNWEVDYVGHPLIEEIEQFRASAPDAPMASLPVVAVLPGSRKQEISVKLPVMLEASRRFPGYHFIVAKAPGVEEEFYDRMLQGYDQVSYVSGKTYALLRQAHAAMVTSGTATLETALFGVPEVVCYKGSRISYEIGKRLVKVKFISLVNLIMNREVVKELIQHDFTISNLEEELNRLLKDNTMRERLKSDYAELSRKLQTGGHASAKAAAAIMNFLRK